jgi:hypothetical protein
MSLQGCFWICFLLYAKIRAGGCQLFWYRHMHLYIWYVISVFSTVVIVDFQVWHTCILASHLAGKYFLTITYWRDSLSTKSYSLLFHSSPSLLLMSPWHPHIVNPKICVHLHAKPDIDLVVGFDVFCPLAIARWSQIDSFFFLSWNYWAVWAAILIDVTGWSVQQAKVTPAVVEDVEDWGGIPAHCILGEVLEC